MAMGSLLMRRVIRLIIKNHDRRIVAFIPPTVMCEHKMDHTKTVCSQPLILTL